MKQCSRCKETKPRDCFSPDRRAKTGLQPACKQCSASGRKKARDANIEEFRRREKATRQKNPEVYRAIAARTREKNRDKVLAAKKAWYNKVKTDPEWQARQKEKRIAEKDKKREYDRARRERLGNEDAQARAKEWAKNNPEKRRAITFNYDSKRRAREAHGVSGKALADWTAEQSKICYWCGVKCEDSFHVDHYQPLAKGGLHELDNLVIACPTCNLTKSAKDPIEFAHTKGRLF